LIEQEKIMGWNKDGSTIKAKYLGEYEFTGVVQESRVSYGGRVLYTVVPENPLVLPFSGESRKLVIVNEDQVTADFGVLPDDKMVVNSLMTGKPVVIDKDTPWCCNPASETFWSM
jgi:hypothetical protein